MNLRLDRAGLWLARKLLAVWVKTHLLPAKPLALGLEPGAALFYVLENRSLANLLVAEQACLELGLAQPTAPFVYRQGEAELRLKNAVAAAVRWRGWLRRRPDPQVSASLRELLAAGWRQPHLSVQLVPVAVFFGRRPDREDSIFKLLLSDNSNYVGRLRKCLIVLLHGRNTWVQFGAPVDLGDFVAQARDLSEQRAARKLSRLFRVHFRQQRAVAVGPELSQLHQLVDQLLRQRSVRAAIAAEHGSPVRAAARARRFAYEIAADFSYPFVVLMRRVLRRLWDRLYDGVEVGHIDTLQRIAPGHTIVYLPCHRSHIDYLLLSYVLHAHGLALPHIAAGVNLNIPLIGPFLRRGGAFFIRRSFRGQALYAAVFLAYLRLILAKGFSVEYFIEGGRSRTGLSLPPRPGMLDMTVRSFLVERGRPLLFVPVYIGYEKLVEGRSYDAELGGGNKRQESLLGLLRGLRALRGEFGRVHLNIGEPLALAELLDARRPGWRDEPAELERRPDWLPGLIEGLGIEVMTRINAAAAVNPSSLLALALLAAPRRALAETELCKQLRLYLQLLRRMPYSARVTVSGAEPAEIVEHGLSLGLVRREPHPLGAIVRAQGGPGLGYYANNVLHVFALPALLGCCFDNVRRLDAAQLSRLCAAVYPLLQRSLFLRAPAERLDAELARAVGVFVELGLLARDGAALIREQAAGPRLRLLSFAVCHDVERFFLLLTLLLQRGSGHFEAEQLGERCRLLAERLTLLHADRPPGFADVAGFRRMLASLRRSALLQQDAAGKLCFGEDLAALRQDAGLMLPEVYRDDVLAVLREPAAGQDSPPNMMSLT